jgi:uroporphyrinogen III methyltransferase / synthase
MDKTPLQGKRILITRARDQAGRFSTHLGKLGAEVIEFPTIEVVPPLHWEELDRTIDQLESYDWIIFTSANGVKFFWERLKEKGKEDHFPSPLRVCAIGPATANQLKEKGIRIDYMPKEYIAEAILEGFEGMAIRGKRILLARARVARDVLPKGLRKMGAEVDVVETYRTIKPRGGSRKLKQLLSGGGIDGVAFTSSSTVDHFVELLKKNDWRRLLNGVAVACIGPVTAHTAEKWGMSVHIQPEEYTIPALTEAIANYFTGK